LKHHGTGAVFDEAQHVPELFSYLQEMVDKEPVPGRFIITGSQHFGLSHRLTQSLAGRAAILELLTFSVKELKLGNWLSDNLEQSLWTGSYPPVFDRGFQPAIYFWRTHRGQEVDLFWNREVESFALKSNQK